MGLVINFTSVYQVTTEVLGYVEHKHWDWFDKNYPEISQLLLEARNHAYQKYLSASKKDLNSAAPVF